MGTPVDISLALPGAGRGPSFLYFRENHAPLYTAEAFELRRVPIRAVEQRSKRGGSPLGLSEWRAPLVTVCTENHSSHEFSERPAFVSSAENPKGGDFGVAFLCLLSLAKQRKKVAAGLPPAPTQAEAPPFRDDRKSLPSSL